MERPNPLISVFIVTYNSQEFIIEALESVKSQTYQNIELIVSDDCSNDNTVSLVKKWLSDNTRRFTWVEIIEASNNTGTSANYNRAVKACHGEWLKMLDGDDKLLPFCISDFVDYVIHHPNAGVVFSKVVGFGDMENANKWPWLNVKRFFDTFNSIQFRIILSNQNFLPSASVFLKKNVWQSTGGYNEDIPLIEDWPFWIKVLENGYKFDFLDKETACYRFSFLSISQDQKSLSGAYMDSGSKARSFANKSLEKINLLYWYLGVTRRFVSRICMNHTLVVFLLNFANPAYYYFIYTIRKFKMIS